jgi:hypothetical protein
MKNLTEQVCSFIISQLSVKRRKEVGQEELTVTKDRL